MDREQRKDTATEGAIERIRKLLALVADNPNKGERDTALTIAHRVMLKHGLDSRAVESQQATAPKSGSRAADNMLSLRTELSDVFARKYPRLTNLPPPRAQVGNEVSFLDLVEGLKQGRSIEIHKPLRGPEAGAPAHRIVEPSS